MKSIIKKGLVFGLVCFTFIAILHSCKKIGDETTQTDLYAKNLEGAKLKIQSTIEKEGYKQTIEMHQAQEAFYVDMDGNKVERNQIFGNNITSTCGGDLPDVSDLDSYSRFYFCNAGYSIKWKYNFSWNNNIVLVNPFNVNNKSKGTIRISTPTNPNAYLNTTYDVAIVDLGADASFPGNELYTVEFTSSTFVSTTIINTPGAILRLGYTVATDCSTLENYAVGNTQPSGYAFSTPLDGDPCTRNDRTFYQQSSVLAYRKIGISGYDPLGQCTSYSAGVAPSLQEVQYNIDNAGWTDFDNTAYVSSSYAYYGHPFVSVIDFATCVSALSVGTHTVKVRYRNWKYNSGVTFGTIPTTSNACVTPVWTEETFTEVVT